MVMKKLILSLWVIALSTACSSEKSNNRGQLYLDLKDADGVFQKISTNQQYSLNKLDHTETGDPSQYDTTEMLFGGDPFGNIQAITLVLPTPEGVLLQVFPENSDFCFLGMVRRDDPKVICLGENRIAGIASWYAPL